MNRLCASLDVKLILTVAYMAVLISGCVRSEHSSEPTPPDTAQDLKHELRAVRSVECEFVGMSLLLNVDDDANASVQQRQMLVAELPLFKVIASWDNVDASDSVLTFLYQRADSTDYPWAWSLLTDECRGTLAIENDLARVSIVVRSNARKATLESLYSFQMDSCAYMLQLDSIPLAEALRPGTTLMLDAKYLQKHLFVEYTDTSFSSRDVVAGNKGQVMRINRSIRSTLSRPIIPLGATIRMTFS